MAAQKRKSWPSPPADSADDIAALAAQAARTRRRAARAAALPGGRDRTGLLVAAGVALLLGMLAGLVLLQLVPGRYWLQARIVFAKESPLATSSELARAQRDSGRPPGRGPRAGGALAAGPAAGDR